MLAASLQAAGVQGAELCDRMDHTVSAMAGDSTHMQEHCTPQTTAVPAHGSRSRLRHTNYATGDKACSKQPSVVFGNVVLVMQCSFMYSETGPWLTTVLHTAVQARKLLPLLLVAPPDDCASYGTVPCHAGLSQALGRCNSASSDRAAP